MDVDDALSQITELLRAEPAVRFAFLFGSRAGGRPRADSDWDLAVFFDETLGPEAQTELRLRLVSELERFGAVDLVPLNRADPLLAHRALGGRSLFIKDRSRYQRFFGWTMRMAEDQRYFDAILDRGRRRRIEDGSYGRR